MLSTVHSVDVCFSTIWEYKMIERSDIFQLWSLVTEVPNVHKLKNVYLFM